MAQQILVLQALILLVVVVGAVVLAYVDARQDQLDTARQRSLDVGLTGTNVGFGIYESLAALGRERALERIDRAIATLAS